MCACKLLIHSQRQSSHNHFPKFSPLVMAKWGLSFNKNFGGCTFKVEYTQPLEKYFSRYPWEARSFLRLKEEVWTWGEGDWGEGDWEEGREGNLCSGCIGKKKLPP